MIAVCRLDAVYGSEPTAYQWDGESIRRYTTLDSALSHLDVLFSSVNDPAPQVDADGPFPEVHGLPGMLVSMVYHHYDNNVTVAEAIVHIEKRMPLWHELLIIDPLNIVRPLALMVPLVKEGMTMEYELYSSNEFGYGKSYTRVTGFKTRWHIVAPSQDMPGYEHPTANNIRIISDGDLDMIDWDGPTHESGITSVYWQAMADFADSTNPAIPPYSPHDDDEEEDYDYDEYDYEIDEEDDDDYDDYGVPHDDDYNGPGDEGDESMRNIYGEEDN